jgi:hypothetical protein
MIHKIKKILIMIHKIQKMMNCKKVYQILKKKILEKVKKNSVYFVLTQNFKKILMKLKMMRKNNLNQVVVTLVIVREIIVVAVIVVMTKINRK